MSPTIGDVSETDVADSSPLAPRPSDPPGRLRGVITDWGGVMTNPLIETITAWLVADGIDHTSYRTVMRAWVSQAYDAGGLANPIHALELGECTDAEFERQLAEQLIRVDGGVVSPEGLLTRMFAAGGVDQVMHDLIVTARRAGLRTGLLSNSWGVDFYPRHLFAELFDAVVISAEVRMRKPEERIFRLAAESVGLAPESCVFIDDIEENITAAEAIGMIGIHHRSVGETRDRVAELLGISV
jgi:putative hydrolase of the HAD superfamily